MKHATITAVIFLLSITQGSAEFQCPSATFVELGKGVLIDCLISDVNDIYWLRGTEEDHYPIVKIEMGLKTISKVAQDHFDITDRGALVIRDASNDLTGSYVMLHYRTDLVREVDTVTLNVTTLVDSIIIQGPSGGVYPMGSTITLSCTFQKGYVVGWKEYEDKDIFVADTKVTANTKYDNFRVSLSDRMSSLLIIGADLEDAGDYSCNTKSYAHVEIEVPPSLSFMFNFTDDEGTDSTDSHRVIDITCTARNARPAVMIRFKTDGSEWINPSETWTVSKGLTFDTSATLNYSSRKNQTDVFLTCQTFGQKTVPPMEKTIHLLKPNCILEMNNIEATCNCTSNPPVYKYTLSIDGKMEVRKTINVENLGGSTISCIGVNYIGVGTSKAIVLESTTDSPFPTLHFYVIIIVAVILVAVITLVVVYRWRKKHKSQAVKPFQPLGETPKDSKDTELSESALPEQNHLLSEDRKPMENSNVVSPDEEKLLAKKHNHGRFKPTDTENRNARRDNQHGAAGTPTASESKKQTGPFLALIGSQNQSHASPEQTTVQSAQRDSNELGSKGGSKDGSNGAKNKEENEKNKQQDKLKMLKGKFGAQSKQYEEAVKRNLQLNQTVNSKEEGSEDSTSFLEAPQK